MAYQGKFKPKNPSKYKGDPKNIVYRSLLELKFFRYCDTHPMIIEWASEEFFIPYYSPVDRKMHRYFPDVWVKKDMNGVVEIDLIEIKPSSQCSPPVKGNTPKSKRRYLGEARTWVVNSAKWEAAQEFCKDRKWNWKIITEKDLGMKY